MIRQLIAYFKIYLRVYTLRLSHDVYSTNKYYTMDNKAIGSETY